MGPARIFVQIASYRDFELVPTIQDALAQATDPARVHFGICWQYGEGERDHVTPLLDRPECSVVVVPAPQAQGVEWARARAQETWRDEPYVLQTDSHMRFARGWDEHLLDMLASCPSAMPLLTSYCPPFEPPDADQRRDVPTRLLPFRFTSSGALMLKGFGDLRRHSQPQPGLFLSAHFIFAKAAFWHEMPPHPEVCFLGEEILRTLRAWTRGWDIFHPHVPMLWHCYNRQMSRGAIHYDDIPNWSALNARSEQQMRQIIGMDPADQDFGIFGLGTARTVADFERLAGVDFQRRLVNDPLQQAIGETTRQLVIACARQGLDAAGEDRVHRLLEREVDWVTLSTIAHREGVMPLVTHQLLRLGAAIVPQGLANPKAFYLANALHRGVWERELATILSWFEEAGIESAIAGGPCMTSTLYADPDWRQIGSRETGQPELELLVTANDVARARALLLTHDYKSGAVEHDGARVRESLAGAKVDVVLQGFEGSVAEALFRRRVWMTAPETKTRVPELTTEALALYLSRQICCAEPARFSKVVELAALLQSTLPLEHESLATAARTIGWEAELSVAVATAHRIFGMPVSPSLDRLLRTHPVREADAARLAQRMIAFDLPAETN